jgi:hypothetical protein
MFILVNFGTSNNGLWNRKRFNFPTVLEAVEAGEESINNRPFNKENEGFVVIASYYEGDKNRDEMKVVYEENTEKVTIKTFPHISVRSK